MPKQRGRLDKVIGIMNTDDFTVEGVIGWTTEYFQKSGIAEARMDAEVLLAHVLNCPRLELYLKKGVVLKKDELKKYKGLIIERKKHVPLSYILGEREFMGMRFKVTPSTLIPRPETELLVEEVQRMIDSRKMETILEIGTGSGNIAAALAKYTSAIRIYASDVSIEALRVAQSNINDNGLSAKVTLKQGDLFDAFIGESLEGRVDMIVSNPPYVALADKDSLMPELSYEPQSALFGGTDGLDFYIKITAGARQYLKKGGFLAFELNSARADDIQRIVSEGGFKIERIIKDYSGLERILIAEAA